MTTLINSINNSVSSMIAHSRALGIVSNNLSNSNTHGYKTEDSMFDTIAVDLGVVKREKIIMAFHDSQRNHDKQGALRETGIKNDLSIVGRGFLTLLDESNSKEVYTRDGRLQVREDGILIHTASKMPILGIKIHKTQGPEDAAITEGESILIDTKAYIADQTDNVKIAGNLPSSAPIGKAKKMRTFIFDQKGASHPIDLIFTKESENKWRISYSEADHNKIAFLNLGGNNVNAIPNARLNNDVFQFFTLTDKEVLPVGFSNVTSKKINSSKSIIQMTFGTGKHRKIFNNEIEILNTLQNEGVIAYDKTTRLNKSGGYNEIISENGTMTLMDIGMRKTVPDVANIKIETKGVDPLGYIGINSVKTTPNNTEITLDFENQQYKLDLLAPNIITNDIKLYKSDDSINGSITNVNVSPYGDNSYTISVNIKDKWKVHEFNGVMYSQADTLALYDNQNRQISLSLNDIIKIKDRNISNSFFDLSNRFISTTDMPFAFKAARISNVTFNPDNNAISFTVTNNDTGSSTIFSGNLTQGQNQIKISSADMPEQYMILNLNQGLINNIFDKNQPGDIEQALNAYISNKVKFNGLTSGQFKTVTDSDLVISGQINPGFSSGTIQSVDYNEQDNTIDIVLTHGGNTTTFRANLSDNGIIKNNRLMFNFGFMNIGIGIPAQDTYNTLDNEQRGILLDRLKYSLEGLKVKNNAIQNQALKELSRVLKNSLENRVKIENGTLVGGMLDENGNKLNHKLSSPITIRSINNSSEIKLFNLQDSYEYSSRGIESLKNKINAAFEKCTIKNGGIFKKVAAVQGELPHINGSVYSVTSDLIRDGISKTKITIKNGNEFSSYYGTVNARNITSAKQAGINSIISFSNEEDVLNLNIKSLDMLNQSNTMILPNNDISSAKWHHISINDTFNNVFTDQANPGYVRITLTTKKGASFHAEIPKPLPGSQMSIINNGKPIKFISGTQEIEISIANNKVYMAHNNIGMLEFINDLNEFIQGLEINEWQVKLPEHRKRNTQNFAIVSQSGLDIRNETFRKVFIARDNDQDIINVATDNMLFKGIINNNKIALQDGNNILELSLANNSPMENGTLIESVRAALGLSDGHYPLSIGSSGAITGKESNLINDAIKAAFGLTKNGNSESNIVGKPTKVTVEKVDNNIYDVKITAINTQQDQIKYSGIVDLNQSLSPTQFHDINNIKEPISINVVDIINENRNYINSVDGSVSAKFITPNPEQKFISAEVSDGDITLLTDGGASFKINIPNGIVGNNLPITALNGDQSFTMQNNGREYNTEVPEQREAFIKDIINFARQYIVWTNNKISSIENGRFAIIGQENINIEKATIDNTTNNNGVITTRIGNIALTGKYIPGENTVTLRNGNIALEVKISNPEMTADNIANTITGSLENTTVSNNVLIKPDMESIRYAIMSNAIIDISSNATGINPTVFDTGSTVNIAKNIITQDSRIFFNDDFYIKYNANQMFDVSKVIGMQDIGSSIQHAFNGRVLENNAMLNDIAIVHYSNNGTIKALENVNNSISRISDNGFDVRLQNSTDPNQIYNSDVSFRFINHEKGFGQLTQLDGEYSISNISQNGMSYGEYREHFIGDDGILYYKYSNGHTAPYYRIPISTFTNPAALDKISNNTFQATEKSGHLTRYWPERGNAGSLHSSSLEMSNVDITDNMVKMIKYQQAFSASAKLLTASDEMIKTVIEIKR